MVNTYKRVCSSMRYPMKVALLPLERFIVKLLKYNLCPNRISRSRTRFLFVLRSNVFQISCILNTYSFYIINFTCNYMYIIYLFQLLYALQVNGKSCTNDITFDIIQSSCSIDFTQQHTQILMQLHMCTDMHIYTWTQFNINRGLTRMSRNHHLQSHRDRRRTHTSTRSRPWALAWDWEMARSCHTFPHHHRT